MIKIRFHEYKGGDVSLKVTGHSGSAEKGEDLICAAASMLVYTLAQLVKNGKEGGAFDGKPTLSLKPGDACIRCRPKDADTYAEVARWFLHTQTGLLLLEHNAQGYVKVFETI